MFKNYIREIIKDSLSKIGIEQKEIIIEYPKNSQFGDISTNIAMQLAGELKRSPRQIAHQIIENFDYNPDYIEQINIAGAGFINFKLNKNYYHFIFQKISEQGENYGFTNLGNSRKAQIEYVSANPTGLLHLGHGRNAVIGDTIANIYEWLGFKVDREYYFNNAGNQMRNLARSIYARYRQLLGEVDYPFPEDGYFGEYIIEIAQEIINKYSDTYIDDTPENLSFFQKYGEEWNFKKIRATLERLNVFLDYYFNENTLYETGKIAQLLKELKDKNLIYEKDNAIWLKLSEMGMEEDRVAVKSTGEPTYRLPDIAYHIEKFRRGYSEMVDVFGSDHIATYPDVIAVLKALGYDTNKIRVVIYQFITIVENGEQVKMSKRSGKSYTLDELIDEVGSDVVRYFFLMRGVNTHLEFDLDLAKEQSEKNPVYYLQYAYARICSIFQKAKEENIELLPDFKSEDLSEQIELDLIKKLADFPEIIYEAYKTLEPHLISDYLYDLAGIFHQFYHDCRILQENDPLRQARLHLAHSVRTVLKNGLQILGISAPERM
ncbi:MAG TPA: arginine--tRNA ligase [Candidatus Kapabacteria bacterium]|nr:arginine--tRNA ligase [Candidatus Kapabacteria bacterium]